MMVLLIGPRAAGKTTIGQALATKLQWLFIDLDERVREALGGQSIENIWQTRGEPAWRGMEAATLRMLLDDSSVNNCVLALGGGTVMIEDAKAAIDDARASHLAHTVYLSCESQELARRLRMVPGDRPSLTGDDIASEMREVLARREATYVALADLVVDVTERKVDEVATTIQDWIRTRA